MEGSLSLDLWIYIIYIYIYHAVVRYISHMIYVISAEGLCFNRVSSVPARGEGRGRRGGLGTGAYFRVIFTPNWRTRVRIRAFCFAKVHSGLFLSLSQLPWGGGSGVFILAVWRTRPASPRLPAPTPTAPR